MKQLSCFLTCLMLLFLTACSTNKRDIALGIDSGLLSEKPCKAPCWQNLTPGLSTAKDVDQFLNNLSKDKWKGQFVKSYKSGCKYIRISDVPGDHVSRAVEFTIENGKLTLIQSGHPMMPNLKQIADHFGPPEYFEAVLAVGPDGELYIVEIYYPKQGLAFLVSTKNTEVGLIKQELLVDTIQYFLPGDMLSYFTTRYSCGLEPEAAIENAKDEIGKFVQQWHGFGEVKVTQSR